MYDTVMKRFFAVLIILLGCLIQAQAVLKEKDLKSTLSILRQELTNYHRELSEQAEERKKENENIRIRISDIWNRSNQNALMLYSQKTEYVFDLSYACHEATEQYRNFNKEQQPFKAYLSHTESEIARFDSLVTSLSSMRIGEMDSRSKTDRNVCLTLATSIKNTLEENSSQTRDYILFYDMTEKRLSSLNDYAQKRYNEIQTNIFVNGSEDFISIIRNFKEHWANTKEVLHKKYTFDESVNTEWNGLYIIGLFVVIIFYIIIATILNLLVIRFLVPKRYKTLEFRKKQTCITMATTTVTFAVCMGVLHNTDQHFVAMASNLLIEFAWLLGVILFSLLLRVSGDQIKSAFIIYTPLVIVGLLVITFRIVLIPNELVNIIFPVILLICTIWQWLVIIKHNKNIPSSDKFYSYASLLVFVASLISSWIGYTLLSVQMLIWWVMQLTCILTIACLSRWINIYGVKHQFEQKPITKTWFHLLIYHVLLPVLGICSIMISLYWAAEVFNLTELCWRIFNHDFVDLPNLRLSMVGVSIVICLWFLFSYFNKVAKSFMRLYFIKKNPANAESQMVMVKNVLQVIIWGVWFILALAILHVSYTWLVVISGGLSTGIGFAMKDIIENIYYGISLMAGRIKVGDFVDVDSTIGKVTSISYTSTMIESLSGEVIAFQNSQLFSKNYKNMTRNHGYVAVSIPFGIAYGSNIKEVRKMVEEAVSQLRHPNVNKHKNIVTVVTGLGDSSVDLKMIVWAEAVKKAVVFSDVTTCIYETLNEHGIEIPFPQRDVHLKQ